jgi:DNA repair exonuclease SbcCD ATPase subunit
VNIYSVPGTNIFLLDAPGFGDTYRNDTEVLSAIANALGDLHEDSTTTVNGVIYIHAINEAKIGNLALKNIRMFQNLIGEANLNKARLVLTKRKLVPEATAMSREKELMNNKEFWQPLIALGAEVEKFNDSKDSALKIIHSLADLEGFVPQVTDQYTVKKQSLHQTAAGKIVDNGIEELKEQQKEEIEVLRKQSEKEIRAKNIEVAALIDKEREAKERELREIKDEQARLQRTREDQFRELESQFRQRERERKDEFERLQMERDEKMRRNERDRDAELERLRKNQEIEKKQMREEMGQVRRSELQERESLLQKIEQDKRKYQAEADQERKRYEAEVHAQRDILLKTREDEKIRSRMKSARRKSRLGRWVTRGVGAAYVVGLTVMTGGIGLPVSIATAVGLEIANQVQKKDEEEKLGYQ